MAEYETEEQQVEALKKWWADNGRAVLLGIGLGLALIFGYRAFQGYKHSVAQDASGAYTQVLESLENNDDGEKFLSLVADIRDEHGDSPYAAMASLAEARFQVENDQLPAAESALRWAVDKGSFKEIVPVARMRLARVLKAQDKHEEALDILDDVTASAFTGHVEEIKGDIFLDLGKTTEAAGAYRRAQSSGGPTNSGMDLQMKIDDLAIPETASEATPDANDDRS